MPLRPLPRHGDRVRYGRETCRPDLRPLLAAKFRLDAEKGGNPGKRPPAYPDRFLANLARPPLQTAVYGPLIHL